MHSLGNSFVLFLLKCGRTNEHEEAPTLIERWQRHACNFTSEERPEPENLLHYRYVDEMNRIQQLYTV